MHDGRLGLCRVCDIGVQILADWAWPHRRSVPKKPGQGHAVHPFNSRGSLRPFEFIQRRKEAAGAQPIC